MFGGSLCVRGSWLLLFINMLMVRFKLSCFPVIFLFSCNFLVFMCIHNVYQNWRQF